MSNDLIKIINGETGEEVEREMTAEEQAVRDSQLEVYSSEQAKKATEQAEIESKKASAAAKLEALGLTADDLKALGL